MFPQTFVNQVPSIQPGGFVQPTTPELLNESCLFACSPIAVEKMGGPITNKALTKIRELYDVYIRRAHNAGLSAIVDVRVHRLMPGMFPDIPGWHCDYVPRGAYSGQPNFSICHPHAFHVALLLSTEPTGVSNTQFVNHPIKPHIWDNDHVYRNLHTEVERIAPPCIAAPDGQFVWFNQKSIHRAMPAQRRGTRLFMRFSMVEKPVLVNERAQQQQVYTLSEGNGW